MAENIPPGRLIQDGGVTADGEQTGFPEGVDSFSHPLFVRPTQLRWGENIDLAGAFPQVRPGYKVRFEFDLTEGTQFHAWWVVSGQPVIHPQMCAYFKPSNRTAPQLVFAVSGSVWYCEVGYDGKLTTPILITQFQFNKNANQLTWARCVQSAMIISGLYANNIVPRNLLIIQDGLNRAGVWDGGNASVMNPTKNVTQDADGNTLFTNGYNETRIGLWMAWSGNRLWIANGPNLYASDLKDPLHFTEELVLNSAQSFTLPSDITGMVDRGTSGTTRSQLFVFTTHNTWTIWSGLQNRLPSAYGVGWAYTQDFMSEIFQAVGCVAGKSIILHRGLLYWRDVDGLVLFDSTGTINSTQNLPTIDQEITYSTQQMSSEVSQMCAGLYGQKVFWSAPVGPSTNGRSYNGHTQVLDRQTAVIRSVGLNGPFNYNATGWLGVWTGIRPVEWANVPMDGADIPYALSMDQDGVVRIWEAFQASRTDNGHEIPWQIETRMHKMDKSVFSYSSFKHFRLIVDQIVGNLQVTGYWRGLRSAFHELLTASITATPGSILTPIPPLMGLITNSTPQKNYLPQSRTVISRDYRGAPDGCQSAGISSTFEDATDHAFSLLIKCVGRGAITSYRMASDAIPENTEGTAEKPTGVSEDGFNIVPGIGCPEHIEGTTPDYVLADQPRQYVTTPFLPSYANPDLYQAPTA